MARWITASPSCHRIPDPAAGLGVFFRAILDLNPRYRGCLTGYDMDPQMVKQARELWKMIPEPHVRFVNDDDMWADREECFIPPCQRFRKYSCRSRLRKAFENRPGITLSGRTNRHAFFRATHAGGFGWLVGQKGISPTGKSPEETVINLKKRVSWLVRNTMKPVSC